MAITLRDYFTPRVGMPPRDGISKELHNWLVRAADQINIAPLVSTISYITPESNQSAIPGTLALNIASGTTVAWLKTTGFGNTGWTALTQSAVPAAHVLATTAGLGPEHTVSGLTARQVLIATAAAAARFRALEFADLPAITLDNLSDVVIAAAAANDLLQHNGTNWVDVANIAYGNLPTGGGTWANGGALSITGGITTVAGLVTVSTSTPQASVRYDGSNRLDVSVSSAGAVTYDAVGASAGHTFSDAVTVSGLLTASAGATVSGGSLEVTGAGNDVLLDNNNEYNMKDSGGTARVVATLTSGDILIFGPGGGPAETRIRAGSAAYLSIGSTGGTASVSMGTLTGGVLNTSTNLLRGTTDALEIQAQSASRILKLTRTTTSAGSAYLGADSSGMTFYSGDATHRMLMTTAALSPATSGGLTLGSATLPWGHFYLGNGGEDFYFNSTSVGGGTGVMAVANATANPSSNPTGGGILYATGGAGTWRGSGGTVTTFGPAGPHCGKCGYDFWRVASVNDRWGASLRECGWCGTVYRKGPKSVLQLLTPEQHAELIYN